MISVEHLGEGRMINKDIYLGETNEGTINLRTKKGNMMSYGKNDAKVINFPGEYDMAGMSVKCIEADGFLSYIIVIDDAHVAVLQNSAVLEVTSFDNIDEWICTDPSIKEEIVRLEMTGDIQVAGDEKGDSEINGD